MILLNDIPNIESDLMCFYCERPITWKEALKRHPHNACDSCSEIIIQIEEKKKTVMRMQALEIINQTTTGE